MENTIRKGKRPGDPLKRRVWRDFRSEWKRYLMIFLLLVVTIGFVSGMYVANNSMMKSLSDNAEKLCREDGHFRLSAMPDDELLEKIENSAVPVKTYGLFYKEDSELLPEKSGYKGKVRVYTERSEVDLYDILKGHSPESAEDIIIDRMHADNAGIHIGDTVSVGGTDFTVTGFAAFVDYTALYENNSDTMFDALTFDVAMVTDEGFSRLTVPVMYNYAFRYVNAPPGRSEEKKLSDAFIAELAAIAAGSGCTIEDYVPVYANQAVNFASDDLGKDKSMGGVILYIITAVFAFIIAVTISTTLEKEASVIGTLRASGYTKGEMLRYYMSAPLIVFLFAAVVGNLLGYTFFKNAVVDMYRNSYSLPAYKTLWTPVAFVKTTIVPFILMAVINFVVITRTLKLSPLRFLRHDLRKTKRKKAIRLPHWSFFSRFRMRVFLQNIPNYIMLFTGITFVMLMLTMAVGMPDTLSHFQDNIQDMVFAEDQVILASPADENGTIITTAAEGAEPFSVYALERRSSAYDEEVTVYGVCRDSRYISLPDSADEENVCISKAYADKYRVKKGDTIRLSDKFEDKQYRWKVCGITDYSAGIAVFTDSGSFNRIFEKPEGSFSGYMSDTQIDDIDRRYIAKEITSEDMMKLAKQLDHSLGSYMTYFQYLCVIIAAIILYLLTKIVIEKNERSISMAKILGYTDAEIASLYMLTTAVMVLISEVAAVFLGYILMKLVWAEMMMTMSGWFEFKMTAAGFVKEFLLVFAAYLLITAVDLIRIRHIPKTVALKNVE
ncbi:MAG: FtsX-like permease family protein [Ruminococcus sp.]|nr:FtsX-like permease family protein [Ruminococcus sp.]